MSYLWMCLSLLFVLQQSVSSDEAVSLNCSEKMEFKHHDKVLLNCSIKWKTDEDCSIKKFTCHDRNGPIDCRNVSKCLENLCSFVSLIITGVNKTTNVTVDVSSNCGLDSQLIQVHFKAVEISSTQVTSASSNNEGDQSHPISTILGVLTIIIVVAVLIFLIKCYLTQRSQQNQGSEPEGDSSVRFLTPA